MAEKMKMSHNVAGVTLLALGNGAPGKDLKQSRTE
jgi:Ca2+/Na+ antiporter